MAAQSIYDYPDYYDILFGWDRTKEADFYHRVFERCGVPVGERLLEVACGTGQVARLLARRGWAVTGLDIRPSMVEFLRERAAASGALITALCGDMTAFQAEVQYAAAYNPMSSFRLLHDDAAAEQHLKMMATAIRPGGVYVLDLDLLASPDALPLTTDESWEMTRGRVTVRADNDAVHVNDDGAELTLAWGNDVHLRGYTAAAFARRVDAVAELTIESWHPECSRATGVSEFNVDGQQQGSVVGRAMVVVRRSSEKGERTTRRPRGD